MHESDGGWTVTGARGVRGYEKTTAQGKRDLFRVYTATVMVGDAAVTCFDAVVMVGDAGMMLR